MDQEKILEIVQRLLLCDQMMSSNHELLLILYNLIQNADDSFLTQICSAQNTIETLIEALKSGLEEENEPALKAVGVILGSPDYDIVDYFIFHNGVTALLDILKGGKNLS